MNNFSIEFLTGNTSPNRIVADGGIRCTPNKKINSSLNSSSSSSSLSPQSSPTQGNHQWTNNGVDFGSTDYNLKKSGWKISAEFKKCQVGGIDSSYETLFASSSSPSSTPSSSPGPDVAKSSEIKVIQASSSTKDKPTHSYIALISMAILNSKEKRMLLADIYYYIMDKFPYFNNVSKAWRNSIRYNLSFNECFIKNGKSENGKGNFWSIHPACIDDFSKGDFRRRQARRRARNNEMTKLDLNRMSPNNRGDMRYVPMTSSILSEPWYPASSTRYHSPPPTTYSSLPIMPAYMYSCNTAMLSTFVNQANSYYHRY